MIHLWFRKYGLFPVLAVALSFAAGEVFIRLAALVIPEVDYLASASFRGRPKNYDSLDSFLAAQKHLIPHRNWANYAANGLGFVDEEFEPGKTRGRFRIMALGDSFCYGMVPYPANVQTLVEGYLNRDHPGGVEIQNFGLPGAHTWEYETLFSLARPVFEPDLVVIHFYLGNDGPDLLRHRSGVPVIKTPFWSSHLIAFVRNAVKLLGAVEEDLPKEPGRSTQGPGGSRIDPALPDPDDGSPSFSRPRFTVDAFAGQMAEELVRLYNSSPESRARDWAPVLKNLDGIREEAQKNGLGTALVLYPSALQVYPELRAESMSRVEAAGRIKGFDSGRVDPLAPNRFLMEYARRKGVPCLDLTPAFIRASKAQAADCSPRPLYLNRDTHWNFLGNRVAARAEAAFLKELIEP